MKNPYWKNYSIYLGGAIVLGIILGYAGLWFYGMQWLLTIAGTIVATVMTHKELGHNIEFGKAIGPVLLWIGAGILYGIVITIVNWGFEVLSYSLPFILSDIVTQLAMGISVLLVTGAWYMFEKAGKPGWAILVPIYNIIVMCEIAGKPSWWVAMILLVPIANIVFLIMMLNGISKNFGKDSGFTVGLVFLRQIFFAILGYGEAQYLPAGVKTNQTVIDDI